MFSHEEAAETELCAWNQRWPNACANCGGAGGYEIREYHGLKYGPPEVLFEPCDALPENQCHRCGATGALDAWLEGDLNEPPKPCTSCGWNYGTGPDDARPAFF